MNDGESMTLDTATLQQFIGRIVLENLTLSAEITELRRRLAELMPEHATEGAVR